MKCFACFETECPVGVMLCDACKAANKRWEREQAETAKRYWEASFGRTSNRTGATLADAYKILGVASNASLDEIKKAYKQKALAMHPDRGGKHEDMVKLNSAYEIIGRR